MQYVERVWQHLRNKKRTPPVEHASRVPGEWSPVDWAVGEVVGGRTPDRFVIPIHDFHEPVKDFPDKIVTILQLRGLSNSDGTQRDIAEIGQITNISESAIREVLRDYPAVQFRQIQTDIPIYYEADEPEGFTLPEVITHDIDRFHGAVQRGLEVGLTRREIARLYNMKEDQLPEVSDPILCPPAIQYNASRFFKVVEKNPAEAHKILETLLRDVLKPMMVPFQELQMQSTEWLPNLFANLLPVDTIQRDGANASILVLGPGQGEELLWLRWLFPEAVITAFDKDIRRRTVLNEIATNTNLIKADLADLSLVEQDGLANHPQIVIALNASIVQDPAVYQACWQWANHLQRTGGIFAATMMQNLERLALVWGLNDQGIEPNSGIYPGGIRMRGYDKDSDQWFNHKPDHYYVKVSGKGF